MRSPNQPDLKPDWDFFDTQDRYAASRESQTEETVSVVKMVQIGTPKMITVIVLKNRQFGFHSAKLVYRDSGLSLGYTITTLATINRNFNNSGESL